MNHKWLKRILLTVAVLLLGGILLAVAGMMMFKGTPDWYHPERLAVTPEQREAAARRAEHKLLEVRNWAELLKADQVKTNRATADGTTRPATRAADSLDVAFSETELNAFFQKWSVANGWANRYGKYLSDPLIELHDGRLILAATVKELDTVASFHFRPSLDPDGRLRLDLVAVRGGRLPLPQAVWTPQRDKLLNALRARLPVWQRDARIDATGAANGPAILAATSKLLFDVLNDRPGEPVLFLPLGEDASIPVRLTALTLDDEELTLTAQPMSRDQRTALLEHIREPYDVRTADAR